MQLAAHHPRAHCAQHSTRICACCVSAPCRCRDRPARRQRSSSLAAPTQTLPYCFQVTRFRPTHSARDSSDSQLVSHTHKLTDHPPETDPEAPPGAKRTGQGSYMYEALLPSPQRSPQPLHRYLNLSSVSVGFDRFLRHASRRMGGTRRRAVPLVWAFAVLFLLVSPVVLYLHITGPNQQAVPTADGKAYPWAHYAEVRMYSLAFHLYVTLCAHVGTLCRGECDLLQT